MTESRGSCSRMRVLLAGVGRRGMRRGPSPRMGPAAPDGLGVSHSEACCQARPGLSCSPRDCTSVVFEVAPPPAVALLGHQRFDPIYATAQRLKVPIAVH